MDWLLQIRDERKPDIVQRYSILVEDCNTARQARNKLGPLVPECEIERIRQYRTIDGKCYLLRR